DSLNACRGNAARNGRLCKGGNRLTCQKHNGDGVTDELFRAEGLSKTYPGVRANDQVSFSVAAGEIHALLGENGAGKSTLVKAIFGLIRPDAGRMWLGGAPHAPADPHAARAAGVGMVFQHFSLFDALTVAENIALGMDAPPRRTDLSR